MVYVVEMDVKIPETWDDDKIKSFMERERETSQKWQNSGKWKFRENQNFDWDRRCLPVTKNETNGEKVLAPQIPPKFLLLT